MNSVNSQKDEEIAELLLGLSQTRKTISPKYFYDERGSLLFERICQLPEYYLTRTEVGIMRDYIGEIASEIGPYASVIEFGSGAGVKTRLLLHELQHPVAYIPVDISSAHLQDTAAAMRAEFPAIEILPVTADFTRPFPLPRPATRPARNLIYFPGSTIGNFEPESAVKLLQVMYQEAGSGGSLLIGVDLKKERQVIEMAYNDSEGVTAQFNLNALRRINREYGADFDLEAFRHQAIYNESAGRIEMYLVGQREQTVSLGGHSLDFARGEKILTEYCHKFSEEQFMALATQAGFQHRKTWSDSKRWFSIQLFER